MATITKIQEGSKGRVDQLLYTPGKNQFVRASDFNSAADILNALFPSSGTFVVNSISESTALADITTNSALIQKHAVTAKTATATLTAAEVKTGYIAVTSASAVTLTLPTGTLLGAALGASAGTVFDLIIDNTASTSSGVVTMAVATNGILSALAVAVGASFGLLTVPVGVTGLARYTLVFSSATAYAFSRTM